MSLRRGNPEDVGLDTGKIVNCLALTREWRENGAFPGVAYLIARDGVIVAQEAVGHAVQVPFERAMARDTIFDVASLTKVVATTTSVMLLLEDGRLHLNNNVRDFFPSAQWKYEGEITIFHLLTHTSGLRAGGPLHELGGRREIVDAICSMDLEYGPGKKVLYSDLGYILLGEIVHRASGIPLDIYSEKHIFSPLGMRDTFFNPPPSIKDRIAATERCGWRKRVIIGEVHDEKAYAMGGVAGHAGLFSTCHDLAIFGHTLLNLGQCGDKRILSPLTVKLMTSDHTSNLSTHRGLGWLINSESVTSCGDLLSNKAYGHTGFTGVSMWIDPVHRLLIILMTNRVHPSRENDLVNRFRPLFHNCAGSAILNE